MKYENINVIQPMLIKGNISITTSNRIEQNKGAFGLDLRKHIPTSPTQNIPAIVPTQFSFGGSIENYTNQDSFQSIHKFEGL